MSRLFPTAVLELLRSGPAHNQLLSPTTGYLALTGDSPPSALRVPWEHRDLRDRLAQLQYGPGSESARRSEVDRLGRDIATVLDQVDSLCQELSERGGTAAAPLHLRLVLGGDELAMIPWELTAVPEGLSGSGLRLLVDEAVPLTMTREVRGSSRRRVRWDREPRVLFVVSAPEEFPAGLVEAHLKALQLGLAPWSSPADRRVTVLLRASAAAIQRACATADYTHVHVLAHGDLVAGSDVRYGVRLRSDLDGSRPEIVSGDRLAVSLRAGDHDGPSLVSLATCDSGMVAQVVEPGGSVAHELHRRGVPWVIASQLPLTVEGSAVLAERFYPAILGGADPRLALRAVRQELYVQFADRHDWASLVAYAAVPRDFEAEVASFAARVTRRRRNRAFDEVQRLADTIPRVDGTPRPDTTQQADLAAAYASTTAVRRAHDDGAVEAAGPVSRELRAQRALWWANAGSIEKRLAELGWLAGDRSRERRHLRAARDAFLAGVHEGTGDHWAMAQWLVMESVLLDATRPPPDELVEATKEAWMVAHAAGRSSDPIEQMWVATTRLELALVGTRLGLAWRTRALQAADDFVRRSADHAFDRKVFRFQLERYRDWWTHESWAALVTELLARVPAA